MLRHDPALQFDDDGRLLRWDRKHNRIREVEKSCCNKGMTKHDQDLVFIKKLDAYQNQLYDNLEVRKRAVSNWRRIRVLLVLMKISGGKTLQKKKTLKLFLRKEPKKPTWKEKLAPYIVDPMNTYKVAWDMFMGFIYLSAYLLDPYSFAFEFRLI